MMKRTMRFLWIVWFTLSPAMLFAQQKNIYLLDVTLSMWGKAPGSQDIFEEVRDALTDAIEAIPDPATEIVVVTFQDKVLDVWSDQATSAGKRNIVRKLRSIDPANLGSTYTNIFDPLKKAESLLDPRLTNVCFLLTDGVHNMPVPSRQQLFNEIRHLGQIANNGDYYFFYVELGDSIKDPRLRQVIQQTDRVQIINAIQFFVLDVREPRPVINIQDEDTFSLEFTGNQINRIPPGIMVQFTCRDRRFSVEPKVLKLGNNRIIVKSRVPLNQLPQEMTVPLHLEIDKPNIRFMHPVIYLKVNNKKEKVLHIEVLDKK